MTSLPTERLWIAELEARVEVLEGALRDRSRRLRQLQRWLCPRDLRLLDLLESPETTETLLSLESWDETTELTSADVDETLEALWAKLSDPTAAGPGTDGDE